MKRISSFVPMMAILCLFVGVSLMDVSCTPDKTPTDGSTADSTPKDQSNTDSKPGDQTTDKAPQETSPEPRPEPRAEPTPEPTPEPKAEPTAEPTQEATPDASTDEPPTDQPAGDQPTGPSITVSGSVGAPDLSGNVKALADVDVCVFQNKAIPCVKSDSAGKFSLPGVPANTETGIVFSKADHVPFVLTMTTQATDQAIGSMLAVTPKAILDGLSLLLGVSVDYSKGLVAGAITDAADKGLANATVAMDPSSGDGPFYMGSNGIPSKSATETSDRGLYIWANVTPGGNVDITVTHATNTKCTSGGWKGSSADKTKIPVVAGHMVAAQTVCTP